jgi:hypothetical protein
LHRGARKDTECRNKQTSYRTKTRCQGRGRRTHRSAEVGGRRRHPRRREDLDIAHELEEEAERGNA